MPKFLARQLDAITTNPMTILFNTKNDMAENFLSLKGIYKFEITGKFSDSNSEVDNPYMVLVGSMSGLMGTDNMKRDIFLDLYLV